jgi:putative ABC transport system permease protein
MTMAGLPLEYAVRNLGRSRARLILSIGGSLLVVLLVIAAGAFVRGMDLSLRATGGRDNIILMGIGSEESVERSEIGAGVAGLLSASISGIRTSLGQEHISPEVHVSLPLAVTEGQKRAPLVMIRGVTPAAMLVHAHVQIDQGRLPIPGRDEVMVGAMAATKMGVADSDLAVGRSVLIDGRPWPIVGRFKAPGTVTEAEVWASMSDLMAATKRETVSCVVLTLNPELAEFADVAAFAQMRLDLELSAGREADYYAKLAAFFGPVRVVVWVTASLIAVGGLFGGLNTMYAAFASRVRELGTLQALGFRRGAIILSLVQESVLATAAGALLACAAAVLLLDGLSVRFSMGAFGLVIDEVVIASGLAAGLALGLIGALPPAWRCLRLSIPLALKAF